MHQHLFGGLPHQPFGLEPRGIDLTPPDHLPVVRRLPEMSVASPAVANFYFTTMLLAGLAQGISGSCFHVLGITASLPERLAGLTELALLAVIVYWFWWAFGLEFLLHLQSCRCAEVCVVERSKAEVQRFLTG
jgi:hypothetical protein